MCSLDPHHYLKDSEAELCIRRKQMPKFVTSLFKKNLPSFCLLSYRIDPGKTLPNYGRRPDSDTLNSFRTVKLT